MSTSSTSDNPATKVTDRLLVAPSDDVIRAILAKHGFASGCPLEGVLLEGAVNHTRLAGDVCLKLLKDWADIGDTYCEVVASPAALKVGVKTPHLLAFDDDRDLHPGPVTIWERGEGSALGNLQSVPDLKGIYIQIAEQAAIWHKSVAHVEDPNRWLEVGEPIDPRESLERRADRFDPLLLTWIEALLKRLDQAEPGQEAFGHWDLHAHNVLVHESRLAAILDWGDAGFGDPILNFTCFPAEFLPEVVDAFGKPDRDFLGRLVKEVVGYAINAYRVPDSPNLRHTGMKRWRSLEALYARELNDEWLYWLGDSPPSVPPLGD